jgi:Acetyltransferase (GNAT) family.
MRIRAANIEEMKKLWKDSESNTCKYFTEGIESRNIEFWAIEECGHIVGELYIIWNSKDKDEADGLNRAYLCALRVNESFRGKGYSSQLMMTVLNRLRSKGFKEATIGIDNREYEKLSKIYNSWGFNEHIKSINWDNHARDVENNPIYYKEPYNLYLCKL